MAFLTDRSLATGVTLNDLIHIVITGDTSQGNPAGSSYKAKISQVLDSITGYCITDLYVSNIHSCSPLNINPLDEGNVYFGSTSGVTIDVINKRIGVNTSTPQYILDTIGTQSRLYYDSESVGGRLLLSGNTNVPRIGVAISPYLTKPIAGFELGMRAWNDISYPGYGKVGDAFFYAGNATYGFNFLNPPGTGTEDYIRFYAGQTANGTTPDIHIQGSGTTRGFVGIGTTTPSEKLHVSGNTIIDGSLSANTISATTYYNLPSISGSYLPLSGGTVTGDTIFTSGLTASTLTVTGLTQTKGITSTGGVVFPEITINSNYTATTEDYYINVSGGTFDITLPSAVPNRGRIYIIKNEGSGIINVLPQLGETIDNRTDVLLTESNSLHVISDGINWVIIGYNISSTQSNTGVIEFSGLSKVSSTQFSVSPVKGYVVDDTTNPVIPFLTYVDYSGGTFTDSYVTTAFETFVYITSGGTIGQQPTPLTEQQRRQNIFLGKIGHPEKTSINLVFSQPDYVISPLSQLRDIFAPINLINGNVYPSANGVNLKFNTSAGYLYGLGINFSTDKLNPNSLSISGTSPCTFQYRTQTGGTVTNVTDIDPLNYDVGGVITPVTGTKATNQRIYLLQNGTFRVQYGQTTYNTMTLAIEALQTETFTPFPNFVNNAVLIGILTVLSTATDLTDTSKARFFFSSKFGETVGATGGVSTTNLQQAYNNSSDPEILINSTLDGLSIKNGTGNADNVTSLLQGLNAAGSVTSFIRADGAISGTSISATTFNLNGSQIDSAWTSYVPVWTASGTNPVIGNGTAQGWYKVIGKTCFVRGNIQMGSTTTYGTGEWYVSMPLTASHADAILLNGNLLDNGTAWYNVTVNGARSGFNTKAPLQYVNITSGVATEVNPTQPFTWTTGDRFIWNGSYEIA
jgi:hypothetical protein